MAYRHDSDLEFLSVVKSEDMEDLVYCRTDYERYLQITPS
jgi:hypothetical protein